MPEFIRQDSADGVAVRGESIRRSPLGRVHHKREMNIYKAPLMLVHKTPPTDKGRISIFVSEQALRYDSSYYGYSSHSRPDATELIQYLSIVIGSTLALWQVLLLSGEFGFERDTVEKLTIDSLPILPFERLSSEQRSEVQVLFGRVAKSPSLNDWDVVDEWIGDLYGLRSRDLQVIKDTLAYNLPHAANREAARRPPDNDTVTTFCRELKQELAMWDERIAVAPVRMPFLSPWRLLCVGVGQTEMPADDTALSILALADSLAATEVVMPLPGQQGFILARLDQSRYWSVSQARLVARRLLWESSAILGGMASA